MFFGLVKKKLVIIMPLPEKLKDFENVSSSDNSDDDENYEVLSETELRDLRDEVKKAKDFEIHPSKTLHLSVNELNSKLDKFIAIFEEAGKEIKLEEGGLSFQEKMRPLAEKMNKILEQNSEIAEGIIAVADMVNDFKKDLETKGVLVNENKQEAVLPPPQQPFPGVRHFEPLQFQPRMPVQAQMQAQMNLQNVRIAPPPFESPRAPTAPPPMSPPKKRLFGL